MEKRAFIHLFRCSTGYYLYDVNTDAILKISMETYNCLKKGLPENYQIKCLKDNGYLSNNRPKITEHPMTPYLKSFYEKNINSVTLQVTQNCNLRCSYCVYSGHYTNRMHSNKRMSWDTAKKGIDFFIEHSKAVNELTLGFYGGEPLLEFELIKNCIDYIESKVPWKKMNYSITTNATLLNDLIIDLLAEKHFDLTISFDGPKEIHDKYRRFANNGKGSYDIVIRNVIRIKEKYPDYFENYVNFNTVLNPEEGYKCVGEYINGEDILKDSAFSASVISDIGLKDKTLTITEKFFEEYNYEYFKLLMAKMGRVQIDNVSKLVRDEFEQIAIMRGGKQREKSRKLPEKCHHGGPCVPGKRLLFVNAEGNFYPCERVCENSDIAMMGNLETGIDLAKAARILNIGIYTDRTCNECWAYRYCNFCVRFADETDMGWKEKMKKECPKMKMHIEKIFKDYCVLREVGYDFETNSYREVNI